MPPSALKSDPFETASLLRRMQSGDQYALKELYDSTARVVYALARSILRNSEDAEEVVCDTYAQAWSQSEKFNAELASPIGWLMMMCRTRAIDRLRHNGSRRAPTAIAQKSAFDLVNEPPLPDELLSLFQSNSRVRQAVQTLRPQRLQLVALAFFDGLTFTEVAQHVGMPLGTVKSHIRRALSELRGTIELCDR